VGLKRGATAPKALFSNIFQMQVFIGEEVGFMGGIFTSNV